MLIITCFICYEFVDFVISAPLSRTGSDSGTIYLYLGAGPSVLVADTPTQVAYVYDNSTCTIVCNGLENYWQ